MNANITNISIVQLVQLFLMVVGFVLWATHAIYKSVKDKKAKKDQAIKKSELIELLKLIDNAIKQKAKLKALQETTSEQAVKDYLNVEIEKVDNQINDLELKKQEKEI